MITFKEWLMLQEANWNVPGYYGDKPVITGEYWIDDSGSAHYADGDTGDYNHESYVIDTVQRQIIDSFGFFDFMNSDYIDWDEFYNKLLKEKRDEYMMSDEEYDDDRVLDKALKEEGIDEEDWAVANDMGDARLYAMKKWGWKAVRGHNVETWNFNPGDKNIISKGLNDILYNEGDISDMPEEELDSLEFTISVFSNNRSFDMSLAELEGKKQVSPQPSIYKQIDFINQAMRNAGNPAHWVKKPPKPGTGSLKMVDMGPFGKIPYSQYRRQYLNNWGENSKSQ